MKQSIVDTNALLRFLLDDVPHQVEKVKQKLNLAKLGKIELVVPQIVIFEIVFNLKKLYEFEKERVIEGVKIILSTPYLKIQDRDFFNLAVQLFQENKLSFVDCFLAAYAQDINGEIFSFDKNLNKLLKSKQ